MSTPLLSSSILKTTPRLFRTTPFSYSSETHAYVSSLKLFRKALLFLRTVRLFSRPSFDATSRSGIHLSAASPAKWFVDGYAVVRQRQDPSAAHSTYRGARTRASSPTTVGISSLFCDHHRFPASRVSSDYRRVCPPKQRLRRAVRGLWPMWSPLNDGNRWSAGETTELSGVEKRRCSPKSDLRPPTPKAPAPLRPRSRVSACGPGLGGHVGSFVRPESPVARRSYRWAKMDHIMDAQT